MNKYKFREGLIIAIILVILVIMIVNVNGNQEEISMAALIIGVLGVVVASMHYVFNITDEKDKAKANYNVSIIKGVMHIKKFEIRLSNELNRLKDKNIIKEVKIIKNKNSSYEAIIIYYDKT